MRRPSALSVRSREPGESVLTAFRRCLLDRSAGLSEPQAAKGIAAAAKVIASSPDLQSRERAVLARHTQALARVIADEMGESTPGTEAAVVATALMGVHITLVELARTHAAAGLAGDALANQVRTRGTGAFDRLEHGLGGYAIKRAPAQGPANADAERSPTRSCAESMEE